MNNIVLSTEDPNKDVSEAIYRLEDRAEKILTLNLAVMAVNLFTQSASAALIAAPFFFASFLSSLLTFMGSPTVLIIEAPRAEIVARIQKKQIEGKEVSQEDKEIRKRLFSLRDRKVRSIQIAHSSFFGLVNILFTTFLVERISPKFFENITQAVLYEIVFILISIIFYLIYFKSFKKKVVVKNPQNSTGED